MRDLDDELAIKVFEKQRKKPIKHTSVSVTKADRAHNHEVLSKDIDNDRTLSVLVDNENLKLANKTEPPKKFQNDAQVDFDSDRWTSDNIDFEFMTGV